MQVRSPCLVAVLGHLSGLWPVNKQVRSPCHVVVLGHWSGLWPVTVQVRLQCYIVVLGHWSGLWPQDCLPGVAFAMLQFEMLEWAI